MPLALLSAQKDLLDASCFDPANIVTFQRDLDYDFVGLAKSMQAYYGWDDGKIYQLSLADLFAFQNTGTHSTLTDSQSAGLSVIASDLEFLEAGASNVSLRIKTGRAYSDNTARFFHPDGLSRILVPYNEPVPLWIENTDAIFNRPLTTEFDEARLYEPRPGAQIHRMTAGSFWHFTGLFSEPNVEPLLHQGVDNETGKPPLLIAIADPAF